ncbi:hypothetical protein [Propioniciclava soli]|uniref:hypothetical protein n=1 Tax=Propioniciclava soli TaxID=2775081 RepID=UPI001E48F2BC|nr:hypothetical protein [Propioniciclava soli]
MTLVMVARSSSVSWSRLGQAGVDVAAGSVEGPALGVVDEQVVDGDVEDLGYADDGFEAGGDLGVLVAETWRASERSWRPALLGTSRGGRV